MGKWKLWKLRECGEVRKGSEFQRERSKKVRTYKNKRIKKWRRIGGYLIENQRDREKCWVTLVDGDDGFWVQVLCREVATLCGF